MRIKDEFKHEITIERSTFICYLKKVMDESQAREYIAQIKKLHPDANHHCTAFVTGDNDEVQRTSDDGEPSGTAGVPMLTSIRNNDLHYVCAIVVRYFGGIKLGAGGLVRAYSKSVSEAIQLAPKVKTVQVTHYLLTFNYDLIGKFDYILKEDCDILEKNYDEKVSYLIQLETDDVLSKLTETSSGTCTIEKIETLIVEREIL